MGNYIAETDTCPSETNKEEDDILEQLKAVVEQVEEDTEIDAMTEQIEAEDTVPFDIDDDEDILGDDSVITLDESRLNAIRDAFRAGDPKTKAEVKKYLVDYNGKLSDTMKQSDVNAIEDILGLNDEV